MAIFAYHISYDYSVSMNFRTWKPPSSAQIKKLNTHDILSLPFCVFPPLTSRLTLKVQAVGFVGQQHQTELPCYSLVVETYPIQTGQLPHQSVVKTCLKPPHSHIGLLLPWTAKVLLLYPLHQTLEAANFPAKHFNCQFPPREYQKYLKIEKSSTKKRRSSIFAKGAAKGTHSPLCFTNHDSAKRPATLDTMTTGHGHHHLGKHALSCSVVWNRWVLLRLILVYSFLTICIWYMWSYQHCYTKLDSTLQQLMINFEYHINYSPTNGCFSTVRYVSTLQAIATQGNLFLVGGVVVMFEVAGDCFIAVKSGPNHQPLGIQSPSENGNGT